MWIVDAECTRGVRGWVCCALLCSRSLYSLIRNTVFQHRTNWLNNKALNLRSGLSVALAWRPASSSSNMHRKMEKNWRKNRSTTCRCQNTNVRRFPDWLASSIIKHHSSAVAWYSIPMHTAHLLDALVMQFGCEGHTRGTWTQILVREFEEILVGKCLTNLHREFVIRCFISGRNGERIGGNWRCQQQCCENVC